MDRKVIEYDEIADTIFAPLYPVVARQIIEKTGKVQGRCLDVGCGGGHLGLCLASITTMDIVLLDKVPEALSNAQRRCEQWGLSSRVKTLLGDARNIPAADRSYDLVISRGSIWFWEDQKTGLKEIYRILNPGGCAYVGGGYGSSELRTQIKAMMKLRDNGSRRQKIKENNTEKFVKIIREIELNTFEIIDDERGFWIVIQKTKS